MSEGDEAMGAQGGSPRLSLRVDSRTEEVRLLARAVRGACEDLGAPADAVDAVELCLVEAANNVVEHGYGGEAGHPVRASLRGLPGALELCLEDEGRPIPPEVLAASDAEAAVPEEAEPGEPTLRGRGLFIIRSLMDEVSYRSDGGRNRLVLVKRFAQAQAAAGPSIA